jgi:mono/diheme cytochrome c family protein
VKEDNLPPEPTLEEHPPEPAAGPGDAVTNQAQVSAGEESSLLNLRTLIVAAIGIVAMILFVHFFAAGMFLAVVGKSPPTPVNPAGQPQAGPTLTGVQLQVHPAEDLQHALATQQAHLSGYGWLDNDKQWAHIPIDRAMQLIGQNGSGPLPTGAPVVGGETAGPAPTPGTPAEAGAKLFLSLGCSGCHGAQPSALAPTLRELYGKPVKLADGSTVTADDAYLRESILDPQAKIVAGYSPVMPGFKGQVNDQQLSELVEYIKFLGSIGYIDSSK